MTKQQHCERIKQYYLDHPDKYAVAKLRIAEYRRNRKINDPDYKKQFIVARKGARARKIEFINNLKDKPCMDCNIRYEPCVMDFDHRPNENKMMGISQMIPHNKSYKVILTEIEKCDVVCANCHRKRTHNRRIIDGIIRN